jgi:hypothetical protein
MKALKISKQHFNNILLYKFWGFHTKDCSDCVIFDFDIA